MDIKINKTPKGTKSYPSHSHKRYEIMHYLAGSGVMKCERGDIPFSEGTVIVMPPGVAHGSASDGEFSNISVESDFGGVLLFNSPVVICGESGSDADKLLSLIWENRYGSEAYIDSLCAAYAQCVISMVGIEGDMPKCVSGIVKQISDGAFDAEIDLARILRQSGYAEDYVRAAFRGITGKTPTEFLTDLRIRHACHLIDIYGGTLALSEIARECGYTDYVYFSKRFKKIMGVSPEKYRKS